MTIHAQTIEEVFTNFKIEYPFLDLVNENQLKVAKLGNLLVVISDVKTLPSLPIPEKIYPGFIIGIAPERRANQRI
jgi:hypothetical protein